MAAKTGFMFYFIFIFLDKGLPLRFSGETLVAMGCFSLEQVVALLHDNKSVAPATSNLHLPARASNQQP